MPIPVTGRSGDGSFDCVDESQRDFCAGLTEVVVSGPVEIARSALAEPNSPGSHGAGAVSDAMPQSREVRGICDRLGTQHVASSVQIDTPESHAHQRDIGTFDRSPSL